MATNVLTVCKPVLCNCSYSIHRCTSFRSNSIVSEILYWSFFILLNRIFFVSTDPYSFFPVSLFSFFAQKVKIESIWKSKTSSLPQLRARSASFPHCRSSHLLTPLIVPRLPELLLLQALNLSSFGKQRILMFLSPIIGLLYRLQLAISMFKKCSKTIRDSDVDAKVFSSQISSLWERHEAESCKALSKCRKTIFKKYP